MSEPSAAAIPGVYYTGKYWNNRPEVIAHLNERATGDPAQRWWEHLLAWHGGPFERILALNCGNGWVEQELLTGGVATRAVGIDIDADLLDGARRAAQDKGLDAEYRRADINTFPFDRDELDAVDLVVNYAAGHHIRDIDAVFRRIADLLRPDGVLVCWDYTGPHRNQYSAQMWEALDASNRSLPPPLRKELVYPHLPTMLATDPSEAVHSELVLPTIERYFDLAHLRHLGGGLAYELVTFNDGFFDPAIDSAAELGALLAADAAWTDGDPRRRSLFTYAIAVPHALPPADQLAAWTAEERAREQAAAAAGGRYGPDTVIGALTTRLEALERSLAAATAGTPPAGRGELLGRRVDAVARRGRIALRRAAAAVRACRR